MILFFSFILIIIPLLAFAFEFFFEKNYLKNLKLISFFCAIFIHILSIIDLVFKDPFQIQYIGSCELLTSWLLYLTSLLLTICILSIWNNLNFRAITIPLFIIEFLLYETFTCSNLLIFYISFEAIIIPMYFLIGMQGSRERKIRAVYMFFFYTLCSSILMLAAVIYIYNIVGSFNFLKILEFKFDEESEKYLWFAFFLSFATKIPMFPFHIWLPEAHVEAPTVGSVLLAGILLKLGVYGLIRFNLLMFPDASFFFSPMVYFLGVCGIIYGSLAAIHQTDMKRIVAYSSIAHMNMVVLGLFSFNVMGIEGAILQSISHGFVSSALFLLIGILYERYHTRSIHYYGGLVIFMPIFSIFFLIFTMANIALPGTSSFVGEFLILGGIFKNSHSTAFFASLNVVLCGVYSLWFLNRVIYGNVKNYIFLFQDLNLKEFLCLIPLMILTIFGGIYPYFITHTLKYLTNEIFFLIIFKYA